ncbi:MAG: hypothetical protein AB7O97_17800 [Planctomycetota bacterium]
MEFLRATKLARSVHLALQSVGVDEDWRALEVTNAVLTGLRVRRGLPVAATADVAADGGSAAPPPVLGTDELASAVQHVLVVTGQPAAAVAFDAVATERRRRRSVLAAGDRGLGVNEGPAALAAPDAPINRLRRE